MVTVGRCCFCLPLPTGGIILGSIGAFTSLLIILVVGGFVLNYDNFVAQSHEKGELGDLDSKKLGRFLETYKNVVMTLMSIYLSLQTMSFVASLSLVCGSINKRPKLLIAWLVSHALLTIFWTIGSVLTNDINLTFYAVICAYFWICIYSLYKSMNLELYCESTPYYGMRAV